MLKKIRKKTQQHSTSSLRKEAEARTRKAKLLKLKGYIDFDTGSVIISSFKEVNALFTKARRWKRLRLAIEECEKCKGLNEPGYTEGAVGWGNLDARIVFVGQSLCTMCMYTGIPFTKGSGYYLDAALLASDLTRRDVYITNVLKCHPPDNRISRAREISSCMGYLVVELEIIKPALVVALGSNAKDYLEGLPLTFDPKIVGVKHPAAYLYAHRLRVIDWIIQLSLTLDKYKQKE